MLSLGTPEPAVVAVGQEATGIFAFGQFAHGFIAVGQVSIGVIAIGQVAVSVVGLGQTGLGVAWFTGMLGVGGRGLCLRLIPGLDLPRQLPQTMLFERFRDSPGVPEAYVRASVVEGPQGLRLAVGAQPLPVKVVPALLLGLDALKKAGMRDVVVHLRRSAGRLVADRLIEVPGHRPDSIPFPLQVLRFVLLVVVATAFWYLFL